MTLHISGRTKAALVRRKWRARNWEIKSVPSCLFTKLQFANGVIRKLFNDQDIEILGPCSQQCCRCQGFWTNTGYCAFWANFKPTAVLFTQQVAIDGIRLCRNRGAIEAVLIESEGKETLALAFVVWLSVELGIASLPIWPAVPIVM